MSVSVKNPEVVNVDTALRVLSQVNLLVESNALALDIGGSLAKLIYLQPHDPSGTKPRPLKIHRVDDSITTTLSVQVTLFNGTLHFFATETRNIHKLLKFIRSHWAHSNPAHRHIRATGGGALKYAQMFKKEIDVTLSALDEMKCTVAGLNFLLTSVDNEVYYYNNTENPLASKPSVSPSLPNLSRSRQFVDSTRHPFPYLLVNIGSGVSIIKVTDHDCYQRVSGSSLGGGTFWGLSRLLLNCATFDDVIHLTRTGNNANIDMLVGDIYGGAYSNVGLDAAVIAASFGKATMKNNEYDQSGHLEAGQYGTFWHRLRCAIAGTAKLWLSVAASVPLLGELLYHLGLLPDALSSNVPLLSTSDGEQFQPEDVALSLLRMVSYNIAQIAHLNARVHGLNRIYFGGNFIREHPYTIADISFAVDFWSKGEMKALFLRHDGYLGAIGAFIGASSATPTKMMERTVWSGDKLADVLEEPEENELSNASTRMDGPNGLRNGGSEGRGKREGPRNEIPTDEQLCSNANGFVLNTYSDTATDQSSDIFDIEPVNVPDGISASVSRRRRRRGGKSHRSGVTDEHIHRDLTTNSHRSDSLLGTSNVGQSASKTNGSLNDGGGWTAVSRSRRREKSREDAAMQL